MYPKKLVRPRVNIHPFSPLILGQGHMLAIVLDYVTDTHTCSGKISIKFLSWLRRIVLYLFIARKCTPLVLTVIWRRICNTLEKVGQTKSIFQVHQNIDIAKITHMYHIWCNIINHPWYYPLPLCDIVHYHNLLLVEPPQHGAPRFNTKNTLHYRSWSTIMCHR